MPDEPAPAPAAALAPDDSHKTVSEAALPEPELEALFAALESSPIRIKTSTPETTEEPEPVQPMQEASADITAPAEVSATINLQAAINAAAFDIPASVVLPPLQKSVDSGSAYAEPAPNESTTPEAEEVVFEPVKLRMPVFDALPPVVPAHLVNAVPAEPAAATPSSAATPITAAPPLKLDDAPAFAAQIEPPVAVKAAPVPAPLVAEELTAAAASRSEAKQEAKAQAKPEARPSIEPTAAPANRRSLVAAALAVVVLGAIGVPLSRLWLGRAAAQPAVQRTAVHPPVQQPTPPRPAPAARAETPAPVAAPSPVATPAPAAPPVAIPAPVPAARTSAAATPAATAPAKPAVAQTPRPAPANPDVVAAARTRPQAPAAPAPQPAPSLTTLAPALVAPAPAVTALAAAAVEAAPAPVAAPAEPPASTPAAGPFFELNDVDRAPRVATRVDAALPASLEGQALNEIVVVRVLVSQTGRPALVSLLRHSKAGLALDEAVIAAVKQWTFTPAVKRGQTVSCFYHVGVPVKGTR